MMTEAERLQDVMLLALKTEVEAMTQECKSSLEAKNGKERFPPGAIRKKKKNTSALPTHYRTFDLQTV